MSYNNVYRVTLKCMAYVFDIQFPTYSLRPPYARVAAPFLEGGGAELLCIWTPPGVGICIVHAINQNGQMFVNIQNKRGSCDDWTFIYTTTTADIVILPFFFDGWGRGAISCSVCFRVVCKQNGPE